MDTSFKGRTYKRGQPLSEDLKQLISDELISSGADKNTGVIPKGVKSAVADRYKVDKNCVTRVWSNVLHHGTASRPHESNAGRPQKLDEEQYKHAQLDSECWGVCVSGDDIYVTCETSDGQGEIRVFGHDGTQKRRVPADWNSWPKHITLSPFGEKIFVTDYTTDIATCMTVDGRTVYTYKNDNLKGTTGIFCDSEDNLFVCCCASNTVQAISVDCKRDGTLLTSSDGLDRPWCIAYRSSNDELIIGCDASAWLLVYKMR